MGEISTEGARNEVSKAPRGVVFDKGVDLGEFIEPCFVVGDL